MSHPSSTHTPVDYSSFVSNLVTSSLQPVTIFLAGVTHTPSPTHNLQQRLKLAACRSYRKNLDDLIHFLYSECRHRIPPNQYAAHCSTTRSTIACLDVLQAEIDQDGSARITPTCTTSANRTKLSIDGNKIDFYTRLGFSDKEVCGLVGCGKSTLNRQREEYKLPTRRQLRSRHNLIEVESVS